MSDILSQIEKIQGNVRDIKATWGNTIMTLDNIKSGLKADRQKAIDDAYQRGFEAGQHEATTLEYQQGLDDVWETIIKLAHTTYAQRSEIFNGQQDILSIVQKFSPSEVIAKLREYEQQKADTEIGIGDEVEAYSGQAIVFSTFTDAKGNKFCQYWYPSEDRFDKDKTETLKKTGRHFPQVAELFEMMKGKQRSCSTCKYMDGSDMSKCLDCLPNKGFNKWEPKEGAE